MKINNVKSSNYNKVNTDSIIGGLHNMDIKDIETITPLWEIDYLGSEDLGY